MSGVVLVLVAILLIILVVFLAVVVYRRTDSALGAMVTVAAAGFVAYGVFIFVIMVQQTNL